ncbi:MAG: hypothetical protein FWH18_05840 [Marinilabiliaceae bacterium]|nr:hypothetical protein [Marinilabiliaceae bacterium]
MNLKQITTVPVSETEWITDLNEFKYSIYIAPEWIEAMQNSKSKAIYINFVLDGIIVGKVSGLVIYCSKRKGKQLYFYASPALKEHEQDLYDYCHDSLYKYAKKNKYSRIVLASYDQQHGLICNAKRFYLTKRYEYVVNLESDIKFKKSFKWNVRRAEKYDIQYSQNNDDTTLNRLFELLDVTKQHRISKYGLDYNPLFLNNLTTESLKRLIDIGMAKMYSVSFENEIQIVLYSIEKDGRIYGLLLGSTKKSYEMGLSAFIVSKIITNAKEKGYCYYNHGGTTVDETGTGLEQFKLSMGADKYTIFGTTTNFIVFPYKLLNPLLNLGRQLPRNNPIVTYLKEKFC